MDGRQVQHQIEIFGDVEPTGVANNNEGVDFEAAYGSLSQKNGWRSGTDTFCACVIFRKMMISHFRAVSRTFDPLTL